MVQDAYECLSNDECLYEYEDKLQKEEYAIQESRHQIKTNIIDKSVNALTQVHYVVSLAASHVYSLGLDIWDMAGEIQMDIFNAPHKIGQYALLAVMLLTKAKIFLVIHGCSYLVNKVNYELAKAQGLF